MKKAIIITIIALSCFRINAQTLTGLVYDKATNQPVPDVHVFIGGTQIIDITTSSGKFSLTIQQIIVNPKLVFSHISYNTFIIDDPFNNLPDTIYMEGQMNVLEEVTVRTIRRVTRRQFDVYRDTLRAEPVDIVNVPAILQKRSYRSLAELLQQSGVAGLNIKILPGSEENEFDVSANIRGLNSFGSASEPLVVVNGIAVGTLNSVNNSLNLYDIESIEVDKTGFGWGSRGANGVIIITTKSGPP